MDTYRWRITHPATGERTVSSYDRPEVPSHCKVELVYIPVRCPVCGLRIRCRDKEAHEAGIHHRRRRVA